MVAESWAVRTAESEESIASLILQRMPKYEALLPPEERGVLVTHELHREEDRERARRIIVAGAHVDIETTVRIYALDLSEVDLQEVTQTRKVLARMHAHGGFLLELR